MHHTAVPQEHHQANRAWIGLGANLGLAHETLSAAVAAIASWPHTTLDAASALFHSAPVDADGPDYTNAVIRICTTMAPLDLLHALQALELEAGRQRPYRNAPRTLDLDILLYEQDGHWLQLGTSELTLPHPRMFERAFVLQPLNSINPALVSPAQLAATAQQRLEVLPAAQQWRWSDAKAR
ncbi:2-amino-4-hydroxy-6-hydroxymethyldihydropteridine diphosphokinase [Lampropedia puyangensis]|uniref:2-amino-4-hydroxy-6-hydroxymethyldihydropteridine pyrophosphokinase n=1 Tax=Lampropedia puyangensis TaxID=1330072 RepID=A0A4S8FCS4_9BURK|nr:2-amino-4-hydroxy-6-hydroxymethyldihydropteridine diphosphokinase [Lampropedia puyangensis]THU05388.1 2-amino-4-hydroxy-6-hydroxymethyldihydropteridine diphosphokinase [Lampropedia puyangensis]